MLTIQQIISEVDALVPNLFDNAKKVTWLNELNKEFFEIVKIPAIHLFSTISGVSTYELPNEVTSQKIEEIQVDQVLYKSLQYDDVSPGHNFWIAEDGDLELHPPPSLTGQKGILKYSLGSRSIFTTGNLNIYPDAPKEYHWTYVLGLCERVAKGMNDVSLANNYGNDYRANLLLAQQNFGTRPKGE
jgi:hypothetical protein